MDLPQKEKTFHFEHVGETTGNKYDGQFTVLCLLNIGQKHAMALEKTRLLGSYSNPTPDLVGYAVALSTLRAKIIDAPEFWKQSNGGANLLDEDLVAALYNKVLEAEEEWKENLKKKIEGQLEKDKTPAEKKSQKT